MRHPEESILNGMIMAAYLGYEFVDAAEVIFFNEKGGFDADKTQTDPVGASGTYRKSSNPRILWSRI